MYMTTAIFGMLSYILVHSYNHVHKIEICQFIEIGKFSFLRKVEQNVVISIKLV